MANIALTMEPTRAMQLVESNSLMMEDSDFFYEKDLKVDKKILAIMSLGGNELHPPLNQFLSKISMETNVHVDVSTSLRDRQGNEIPVLKVKAINQKSLEVASALIMERLDPHRDKMTFNIDVPYNDHSYIIGKDGTRIKQLSRMTGCHIHLPDCNKTSNKKSNKLSIAGTDFSAIDKARDQIRKSLPLNIGFKAQIKSGKFVIIDTASAEVQAVKRKYRVDVTFTNVIANTKYPEVTINVKGGRSQLEEIESATQELYHFVTEEKLSNNPNVVFAITIDVSHSHHQYVKGKNNCNLKVINQRSGAIITFPPNDSTSNQVIIQSKNLLSTVMGWQELMGYLPLLLSFDVNFDINNYHSKLQRLEKEFGVGIRTREKLSGHVYTVLVKTQERHSTYLQEIRQRILSFKHLNGNENSYNGKTLPNESTYNLINFSSYRNFTANVLQPMIDNNLKTMSQSIKTNLTNDEKPSHGYSHERSNCSLCQSNHLNGFLTSDSSLNSSLNETLPLTVQSYNPFNFRENFKIPSKTINEKLTINNNGGTIATPQPASSQVKWPNTISAESDYYYQLQSNCFKCQTYDEPVSQVKSYSNVFKY